MARNTRSRPKAETPGGKAEAIDKTDTPDTDTPDASPADPAQEKPAATARGTGKSKARGKTEAAGSPSEAELAPTPEAPPAETPDLVAAVDDAPSAPTGSEPPVSTADPALTDTADSAATARLAAGTPAPGGDPRKPGTDLRAVAAAAAETSVSDTSAPGSAPERTATADTTEPRRDGRTVSPTTPPAAPAPTSSSGGGGAMPMVLGGFFAAVLGALVVLFFLPNGWQGGAADPELAERVRALEARSGGLTESDLQPLEDRIAALESSQAAAPDLAPLQDRVTALEQQQGGVTEERLNTAIGALTSQLAELDSGIDSRIDSAVSAATADAEAALRQRADSVEAQAEDVEARQARIAARAALAELTAASESGEPAPDALARLQDSMPDAVPDPLTAMADGIAPLATLQDEFSVAARDALAAQPIPENATLGERVSEFFRAQTGARALAPRAGVDVVAVLSRAEAALRQGDLAATLRELDALTGEPAAEMAQWRARAETRLAALQALDDVRAQLDRDEE
ncbi:COG4223 family protein [Pararhodobacter marinus]|uniref:COG4223 family protein n=1 Tax=Pararhodobacter marinus TaxID=2184063 RepID=UPI003518213D